MVRGAISSDTRGKTDGPNSPPVIAQSRWVVSADRRTEGLVAGRTHPLTFLFTDIVGSTRLWQRHGAAMEQALVVHDRVIGEVVADGGGRVFTGGGDGFGVVFDDPTECVQAALNVQQDLASLSVGDEALRVRMGTHTGRVQERDGDYFGLTVNRAARVASAANGGQVLLTDTVQVLVDGSVETRPLGVFQLADLLEPVTLHQAGTGEFPPVRAMAPDRHNLPVRFTSIVGREALIDDVVRALGTERLVTLVGPGGIGKTTVALAAAAELATVAERGVWLVELDSLDPGTGDDVVDGAVASALGLQPIEGWHRTAAGRDQVVVLDNAEHLVEQTARVAAGLLRSGPDIRLLVTSREPLGVPGERMIGVDPLPVGDAAASLFLDRAGTATDVGAAQEIAELTDGVPLAIELVAAHAGRLPPAELVRSLRRHGLTGLTMRGVTARHASSQAVVQWSYDRLSQPEQRGFTSLAVFPQDFTLTMATAVADLAPNLMTGLVEKSLVQPSGGRHFRLLEPIKEFASARLEDDGTRPDALRRHARAVAGDVTRVAATLSPRPAARRWIGELEATRADLELAFGVAVGEREVDLVSQLCLALPGVCTDDYWSSQILDILAPVIPELEARLPATRWLLLRYAWVEDMAGRELQSAVRGRFLAGIAADHGDAELSAAAHLLEMRARVYDRTLGLAEWEELVAKVSSYPQESVWWDHVMLSWLRAEHMNALGHHAQAAEIHADLHLPDDVPARSHALIACSHARALMSLGKPDAALAVLDQAVAAGDREAEQFLRQDRVHVLIALGRENEALDLIQDLIRVDLQDHQPTTLPYCATADFFRAAGDLRTAVWFLAKLLGNSSGSASPVHDAVIAEGKCALGDEFATEWERGKRMDIFALHALVSEA